MLLDINKILILDSREEIVKKLFESKFKCKKEIKYWTEIIETQGKRKKNKERVNAEKNLITNQGKLIVIKKILTQYIH
tara:strand:+ start:137 stop:370 length:234 start_codon:yes stop_codon:yes gene_type:complete